MVERLFRYLVDPAPGEGPLPRAEVYRELVQENLLSVITNALPVTEGILGREGLRGLVGAFLAGGGPKTSLYRDVPGDLVAWAARVEHPLWDLMHWEWIELVAARHPADVDAWWAQEASAAVELNPTLELAVYRRPVDEIRAGAAEPPPFAAPRAYLVWRMPGDDRVEFHRAGLLIGRAIELLAEGHDPGAVAATVAAESGQPAAVIEAGLDAALAPLAARSALKLR